MGFRQGAFATVWSIEPYSDTFTKGRISVSKKDKETGSYETTFSGFVAFIGTSAANKALKLREKDRIRLGDVDVTTKYEPDTGKVFTNFKIFSFQNQAEIDEAFSDRDGGAPAPPVAPDEISDEEDFDDDLPF